jgi:hypothetical protein
MKSFLARALRIKSDAAPTTALLGLSDEIGMRLAALEAEVARVVQTINGIRSTVDMTHELANHLAHSGQAGHEKADALMQVLYAGHEKTDALGQTLYAGHEKTDALGQALSALHSRIDAFGQMLSGQHADSDTLKATIEREIDRLDGYLLHHLKRLPKPD